MALMLHGTDDTLRYAADDALSALADAMWNADNGLDRTFLGSLCLPVWDLIEGHEGTLLRFPSEQVAHLTSSIQWLEEAIQEERELWLEEVDGDVSEETMSDVMAEYIWSMEDRIRELRAELTAE